MEDEVLWQQVVEVLRVEEQEIPAKGAATSFGERRAGGRVDAEMSGP